MPSELASLISPPDIFQRSFLPRPQGWWKPLRNGLLQTTHSEEHMLRDSITIYLQQRTPASFNPSTLFNRCRLFRLTVSE